MVLVLSLHLISLSAILLYKSKSLAFDCQSGINNSKSYPRILIVFNQDKSGQIFQLSNAIAEGARRAFLSFDNHSDDVPICLVPSDIASYKNHIVGWKADAVIVGSSVVDGNPNATVLDFIDTFDFKNRNLSRLVGGSFATGGGASSGLQPVLEALNRGLQTYNILVTGGNTWQNSQGCGIVTNSSDGIDEYSLQLARDEGSRIARLTTLLKNAGWSGGSTPLRPPIPSPPPLAYPPDFGVEWMAQISTNMTQVGYDAGLVLTNFTGSCNGDPSKQKMKTVFGDFYTVLTRCDLGVEFTIAPPSRGSTCLSRKIGRDVNSRICDACGCPFCVRDTNGSFTQREQWNPDLLPPSASTGHKHENIEVTVWSGRASSSANSAGKTFDLETTIVYVKDPKTNLYDIPVHVNITHPLWIHVPDNANCNIAGRLNDADKLLEEENYCAAASIAEDVLKNMPPSKDLELYSRAALIKARATIIPLTNNLIKESEDNPPPERFREPYDLLKLA
eukprot:UC4_evm1s539